MDQLFKNMLDMEHKGTMMGAVKGLEVEEIDLSEDHDGN